MCHDKLSSAIVQFEALEPARPFVNRQFTADGQNQLWVADMTNLPTSYGFIYLAMAGDVRDVSVA
jgi:hypothetical protein